MTDTTERTRPSPTEPKWVKRQPGAAELTPERHHRIIRAVEITLAVLVPVALLALWQVATVQGWLDRRLIPAPTDVAEEFWTMLTDRDLLTQFWVTLSRVLWGFVLGSLFGVVLGVAMGTSRLLRAALEPTLDALYTVPKIAVLPVFLIALGFGEAPVRVVLGLGVFFYAWFSSMAAVLSVEAGFRDVARAFGASPFQTFRHVILPASLPRIFVGLRLAASVAVLIAIGVEFVYSPTNSGIGYTINQSRQLLLPRQAYVGVVCSALMGVLMARSVRLLGRLLTPWSPKDEGAAPT